MTRSVHGRLALMMLLQYAVWGFWLPVLARYLQAANEQWAYRRVSRPRTITVQEHDYVSNAIRYTTTAAVYDRAAS